MERKGDRRKYQITFDQRQEMYGAPGFGMFLVYDLCIFKPNGN